MRRYYELYNVFYQCYSHLTQWQNLEKAALVNVDPPNLDSLWEDSYYIVRNYGIHTCTVMAHTHSLTLTHPLSPPPHTHTLKLIQSHTHIYSFIRSLTPIHIHIHRSTICRISCTVS